MSKTALEIDDLRGLKVYCVLHDLSMKEFVNLAIKEKMDRDGDKQ